MKEVIYILQNRTLGNWCDTSFSWSRRDIAKSELLKFRINADKNTKYRLIKQERTPYY